MSKDNSSYENNYNDDDNYHAGNDNVNLDSDMPESNLTPNQILGKAEEHGMPTTEAPPKLWEIIANKNKLKENIIHPIKENYSASVHHQPDAHPSSHSESFDQPYDSAPHPMHQQPSQHIPHYDVQKNNEDTDSDEEMELNKLDMLQKLGELEQYGVTLSKNYTMDSNYKQMKREYEIHKNIRDKSNTVEWLETILGGACYMVERGNEKFNPFDFRLDGWGNSVKYDIKKKKYKDVLGDIYDKYFKSTKPTSPLIKLAFTLGMSAVGYHFFNSTIKNNPSTTTLLKDNQHKIDKLRARARKDREQEESESIDIFQKKEHKEANEKIQKETMIRKMREQHIQQQMKNENIDKELQSKKKELTELMNQIENLRSDSRSMYVSHNTQPTINKPNLNKYGPIFASPGFHKAEMVRQKQEKKYRNTVELLDTDSIASHSGKVVVKENPNLDDIISSKFKKNANSSSSSSSGKKDKHRIKISTK